MGDSLTRREVMARLGAAALGAAVPSQASAASTSGQPAAAKHPLSRQNGKPNVLWITTEGVPLATLGCYGSRLMSTPNIDRIAREGMRFNNSFVTNALCAPSRATLLTGKYSHMNGMISNPADTTDGVTRNAHFDENQET